MVSDSQPASEAALQEARPNKYFRGNVAAAAAAEVVKFGQRHLLGESLP